LFKRSRGLVGVTALVVLAVFISGCFSGPSVKRYTLTVHITPESAAEVVGLARDYSANSVAEFEFEAAEGYRFLGWEDGLALEQNEDGKWEVPIGDRNVAITAVFERVGMEDPLAAANAAVAEVASLEVIAETDAGLVREARELVDAALDSGYGEDDIVDLNKLVAAEKLLSTIQSGKALADGKELVREFEAASGLSIDEAFGGSKFDLPETLAIGTQEFILVWVSHNTDLVEVAGGEAEVVQRPAEDTTVVLTALLGLSAQAAEDLSVEVIVEGWVSRVVKAVVPVYKAADFKEALDGLGVAYDEEYLQDYALEIEDRHLARPITNKAGIQAAIDKVNMGELGPFLAAVADYFDAVTHSGQKEALEATIIAAGNITGLQDWIPADETDDEALEFLQEVYLPALEEADINTLADLQRIIDQVNIDHMAELLRAANADLFDDDTEDALIDFYENVFLGLKRPSEEVREDFAWHYDWGGRIQEIFMSGQANIIAALEDVEIENVKSILSKEYAAAFAEILSEDGVKISVDYDIQGVVDQVNATEMAAVLASIKDIVVDEGSDTDLDEALNRLLALAESDIPVIVVWNNLAAYREPLLAAELETAEEVLLILAEANHLSEINGAILGAAHQALIAIIVNDFEIEDFINLREEAKLEMAEIFINAETEQGDPVLYESVAGFEEAVVDQLEEYLQVLADLNAATKKTELQKALEAVKGLFPDKFKVYDFTDGLLLEFILSEMEDPDFKEFRTFGELKQILP